MKIVVVDLDNCISEDQWRHSLIDLSKPFTDIMRWHVYHMRAIYDPLGNAHLLRTPHKIVICTGRPARYRDVTMKWLAKYKILPQAVLMREDHDYRPAVASKIDLLQSYLLQTNHQVMHAYDDRLDIITAYREMGLKATHTWIHPMEVPIGH